MTLPQLRRVRWAVRLALLIGVAASVAANILHARNNPVSQVIAAWPPLALLLTIELISRIPVHRRSLAAVRLVATSTIAGIAAWVSYWHMTGVAARYGEDPVSAHLLPLSVDGLVIVASVSLVELAGRIREAQQPVTTTASEAVVAAAVSAVADPTSGAPVSPIGDTTTAAAEGGTMVPLVASGTPDTAAGTKTAARRPARRQTAADRVAKAAARTPAATPAQLAARLSLSERTVQRYIPRPAVDTTTTAQRPSEQAAPALATR